MTLSQAINTSTNSGPVASASLASGWLSAPEIPPLPTPEIVAHPAEQPRILPTAIAYLPLKQSAVFQPLDDPTQLVPELFNLMNQRPAKGGVPSEQKGTPPLAAALIGNRDTTSEKPNPEHPGSAQAKPAEPAHLSQSTLIEEKPNPEHPGSTQAKPAKSTDSSKPTLTEDKPNPEHPGSTQAKPVESTDSSKPALTEENPSEADTKPPDEASPKPPAEASPRTIHPAQGGWITQEQLQDWVYKLSQPDAEIRTAAAADISNFLKDHPEIMDTPIQRKAMIALMVNLARDSDETIRFFPETALTLGRIRIPRKERNQSPYKELLGRIKQLQKIKDPLYAVDEDEKQLLVSITTNWDRLTLMTDGNRLNEVSTGSLT